ncbi:AraC family transcriptional regulator [Corallococcus macrosporus DSM 14697]|uniref:AraC family transcriptional regulator n=1 Tax=Corallococcus macrosporus DSM 14697 TaxID=1189310 RepID=A0A250JS73_9BACT|nr:AraC family transcriptional regulator [Corallococcus macrosporus DSM 14697]
MLDGVAEGPLGVGLDVVDTAARLVAAGLASVPRGAQVLRQRVVSLDGQPVRSGTGRSIAVDGALSLRGVKSGDVLLVPGLSATSERAIEQLLSRADAARGMTLLARAAEKGAMVAASCSATFVLAASGLLAGRSATTTWWLVPSFVRRFPEVALHPDRMVVECDGVLTAGSAFAHADLMLAIVARVASPSLSHLVARYLVLDERVSQARYMVMEHLRVSDPALRAVERFVAANLGRQVTLDELARAAATSPRTLARRVQAGLGMTPLEFVQRVRVAHASHLLETTRASVEEVAARVGYADPAAFRRVFRRYAGETPRGRNRGARSRRTPMRARVSPAP